MSTQEGDRPLSMRRPYLFFLFLGIGLLVHALRLPLLPFDSDQAVVGLMGRHILQGAFPWLYYGDSYGGTLEPLLTAWSFFFFGAERSSLHLIPLVFLLLFMISLYQLGREWFGREVGLTAMAFGALPLFHPGLYASLAYGGYIEILWLGNLLLLLTHRFSRGMRPIAPARLFFLGLLGGVAWWTYPISAVYLGTCVILLFIYRFDWIRKGRMIWSLPGFLLGSLPFWIWNGTHGFPFLSFTASSGRPDYIFRLRLLGGKFLEFFTPAIQGGPTLWTWLSAGLFLGSLILLLLEGCRWKRGSGVGRGVIFLFAFLGVFTLFYLGSRFSEQNALRYFLPLFSLIPLSLAVMVRVAWAITPLGGGILLFLLLSLFGYHQVSLYRYLRSTSDRYLKKLEVEEKLFESLRKKGMTHAYIPEYWSAAELTFNARENPVFPMPFRDRFPLYTLTADARRDTVFVLDGKYPVSFEEMYRALGGEYSKTTVSIYPGVKGYVVYGGFSTPKVLSEEVIPSAWQGKGSGIPGTESRAFDRKRFSFWSTGGSQQEGMFYQLDLGGVLRVNRLVLLSAKGRERDFPSCYRLELSWDEKHWREVVSVRNNYAYLFRSEGRPFWKLREGRTEISFPPQEARFFRITLTHAAPQPWSIAEIFVYRSMEGEVPDPVPLNELISFFTRKGIEYVYADIGLSAMLTLTTRGRIKCLQDDYDLTRGEEYAPWGYNGLYPYSNRLERKVDFSLQPAFVVTQENREAFIQILKKHGLQGAAERRGEKIIFYHIQKPSPAKTGKREKNDAVLYWTGTHLLDFK